MSNDFYSALEDRFRLTGDGLRQRLRAYLPFVCALKVLSPQLRALDIGCGRGEWLRLLTDEGVVGRGVDPSCSSSSATSGTSSRAARRRRSRTMNLTPDTIWLTVAALLTLATLSFLYKDNPFYKFAEHLVVGVSAGDFTMVLIVTSLWPKLVDELKDGNLWYILPGVLGMMMYFRFSKKQSWVARYPIAIYIGIGTGILLIVEMQARVIEQLNATIGIAGSMKADAAAGASRYQQASRLAADVAREIHRSNR